MDSKREVLEYVSYIWEQFWEQKKPLHFCKGFVLKLPLLFKDAARLKNIIA
jgi:hypothetical protein